MNCEIDFNPNSLIFLIVLGSFILLLVICLVLIITKCSVHGATKQRRLALAKSLNLTEQEHEFLQDQIIRTYVYSYSYGTQTSIYLLCSTESIICSVGSLAMLPFSSGPSWQNISMAVAALVFVFITIYVKPAKRSSQYLTAWIEAETDTLACLVELNSIRANPDEHKITKDSAQLVKNMNLGLIKKRKAIEFSITSDFDDN